MAARGFTLIELLVTVAVAAILLGMASTTFRELVERQRGAAAMNQLIGGIATARAEAITFRGTVTLCPGRAGRCLGRNQWHAGALIFRDDDGNGRIDDADRVVTALPTLGDGQRIYWRSFRSRSYLQFFPRGFTAWQNGSFLYCPPDDDARLARMAIVNAQGRVRTARDTDGDGVVEDASGDPVACPP